MKQYINKIKAIDSFPLFIAGVLCLFFMACSSDDSSSSLETPTYESISSKYEITGSSTYSSIELGASGNYIIVKKSASAKIINVDAARTKSSVLSGFIARYSGGTRGSDDVSSNVLYGKYTVNSDGSLNLEGFGKIEIKTSGNNVINISLTPTGGSTETFAATKATQISSDELTNKLCRTWDIYSASDKEYVDNELVHSRNYSASTGKWTTEFGTPYSSDSTENSEMATQVLFSKSGTYLVYYKDGTAGVSTWGWKNESAYLVWYAWTDSQYDKGTFKVAFSGNTLKVIEDDVDTTGTKIERYYAETVLKAAD